MRYKLLSGLGGHPEHGDTVYSGDEEVGVVGFFYARTGPDTWSVQLDPVGDVDPVEVKMVDVQNDAGAFIGRRFVIVPASGNNLGGTSQPSVVIQNNSGAQEN